MLKDYVEILKRASELLENHFEIFILHWMYGSIIQWYCIVLLFFQIVNRTIHTIHM